MSILHKWLRVSRCNFLPTSLLPYCLGSLAAVPGGYFRPLFFAAGLAGTASVHLAANLFNEYWDHRFRADSAEAERLPHFGGSKAIQEGLVSPRAVHRAAWSCLLFALAVGAVLALKTESRLLILLVGLGVFIAWAYTAPPFSLAYRGMGEISLLIAFGPLLTLGGYFLQRGALTAGAAALSPLPGLLIASVLIANEFADVEGDARAGKKNLAVRAGPRRAFLVYRACLLLAYIVPGAAVISGLLPPLILLIYCTVPPALSAVRSLKRALDGEGCLVESSARTMRLYLVYHTAMIVLVVLP